MLPGRHGGAPSLHGSDRLVLAAPLASFIPPAALAGLLIVVCWNMAEKGEFMHLLHHWPAAVVLLATFGLTLAADLMVGIVAGCVTAALLTAFGVRLDAPGAQSDPG